MRTLTTVLVTGLAALAFTACGGNNDSGTTPTPTPTPQEPNVFIDNSNKLMWQDDALAKTTTKPWLETAQMTACNDDQTSGACTNTSGDTAATFCTDMALNSHTDWRLPTSDELKFLYSAHALALKNDIREYYWTSTSFDLSAKNAYSVKGHEGGGGATSVTKLKSDSLYVRCVRGI